MVIPDRADHGSRPNLALAALCLAQFTVVLAFQGAGLVLPDIERAFMLSESTVQWIVSANALALGGLLLPAGRAADRFGHRRVFIAGLLLFAMASLAAGLAPTSTALIAARAAQGAGSALSAPAGIALLAEAFPEGPARHRALALWGAAGPLGGVVAVLFGGAFADILGWRAAFVLGVPPALGAILLARRALPSGGRIQTQVNPLGASTGAIGMALVVYGLSGIATTGASPVGPVVPMLLGAALLTTFVVMERTARDPILPPALLQRPGVPRAATVAFLHGASTNAPFVFYAVFMADFRDASPFETGLLFLPCNGALIIAAHVGVRLAERMGYGTTMVVGMGVIVAGMVTLSTIAEDGAYLAPLLPGLVLWGGGLGIAQVGIIGTVTSTATPSERGVAGGIVTASAQLGTAVGLALLVAIAEHAGSQLDEIQVAFRGAAALALLGLMAALTGAWRSIRTKHGEASPTV